MAKTYNVRKNPMDSYTNGHSGPDPDFVLDIMTTTLNSQRGRTHAELEAIEDFNREMTSMSGIEVNNDQLDRMLLRVFNAGYQFAAYVATTDENLENLVMEPGQVSRTPSPEIALSEHRNKHSLEHYPQISLLTSFIENQGLSATFYEFLKLVDQEKQ